MPASWTEQVSLVEILEVLLNTRKRWYLHCPLGAEDVLRKNNPAYAKPLLLLIQELDSLFKASIKKVIVVDFAFYGGV